MKKEKIKKDFNYIWDIIELPILIILIYNVLELFFSINSYIDKILPYQIINWLITIFAFGLIGYNAIKDNNTPKESSRYGAYAGVIAGLIGAVIGLITFYYYPEKLAEALQKAAEAGADMSMVNTFMKIGLYASFIISPIVNAVIGGFIAWISAMIFNKENKKR